MHKARMGCSRNSSGESSGRFESFCVRCLFGLLCLRKSLAGKTSSPRTTMAVPCSFPPSYLSHTEMAICCLCFLVIVSLFYGRFWSSSDKRWYVWKLLLSLKKRCHLKIETGEVFTWRFTHIYIGTSIHIMYMFCEHTKNWKHLHLLGKAFPRGTVDACPSADNMFSQLIRLAGGILWMDDVWLAGMEFRICLNALSCVKSYIHGFEIVFL